MKTGTGLVLSVVQEEVKFASLVYPEFALYTLLSSKYFLLIFFYRIGWIVILAFSNPNTELLEEEEKTGAELGQARLN